MTKTELRNAVLAVPFERRLAVAVAALDLKKQDVADRAGMTPPVLSATLTGRRVALPDERKALARVIGLAEADLFEAA